jgi:anti-anti-sigma factor
VSGSLDLENADLVGAQLMGALRELRPRVLLLDLDTVDFCDCASLRTLLEVHAEGERTGTRVVVAAASPLVRWLLQLFAVDRLFDQTSAGPAVGESSG